MKEQFLFDSAFANGAYSQSYGLESYILNASINDAKSFQVWLNAFMVESFATNDGVVFVLANEFKNKKLSLLKLARLHNSSILSSECKSANINMTKATLKNTEFMHDDLAKWYFNVCENDNFCSLAVAFSLFSNDLESFAYSSIKTLIINATRAIPIPYKKSSELLFLNIDLAKKSAQKSRQLAKNILKDGFVSMQNTKALFHTNYELEFFMMAHKNLDFRLFMS